MENKNMSEPDFYQAPEIEILEVKVEMGFAISSPGNMWEENGF